ncbi:MAG TPA: ATP-binding protein [Gammaproteobacteria bacterium]|nr:ATP-binding protein [Gammaproteobacteria bacterium]
MPDLTPRTRVGLQSDPEELFAGGGEMGALMRATDWSKSALGPARKWPQSLLSAVNLILPAEFPMVVAWGPDFHFFYNDRYRPLIGDKHPATLGMPAAEAFREVWPELIGPLFERVLRGESVAQEDMLVPLERSGYLENAWFTFSYSAIRDDCGGNGGLFCAAVETTERVEAERRLTTLSELASQAAGVKAIDSVCQTAANVLERNPIDVPFALLYLHAGEQVRLAATAGIVAGESGAPTDPALDDAAGWPLAAVLRDHSIEVVTGLSERFGPLPGGPCPEPAHTAVVMPLAHRGSDPVYGVLVVGTSPRRMLDGKYREFLELVGEHLTAALANARAHETERERAEQLAELDRAKTVFFNNISHEFRTPLTLILGPIERALASAERTLPEEQLGLVWRNALRLSRMVNTLLSFARMEAGRARARFAPTDLAAFTADLASAFRSAADSVGLTLDVDCPPLPEPVYVDPEMWEKIVLNLLSNAVKYTHEGRIDVRLEWRDGEAVLTVADTGVGIPEEELPRVFDRFHRVQTTHGRSHEGTGIGLALVRELVDQHRGSVTAASRLGAGSTFTVCIPGGTDHLPAEHVEHQSRPFSSAAVAPFVEEARRWSAADSRDADSESVSSGAAGASGGKATARILLIDDNADLRRYVAGILRRHFSNVETAADGAAAIAAIRAEPPDLVLSDVMMPGLDGFALVRELRADEHTRAVPVVLLSARAGEEATVEGLESGADDYLIKPFSARELLARVHTQLDMARLRWSAAREEIETEKLRETLEARDEFLSLASHELRTPLTAMRLQAHILARLADDERSRNEVVKLTSSIERMGDLVTDLLDVSRITAGRLKLSPEEVDLVQVVRAAVADVPSRERRDDTQIRQSLPDAVVGRWDRGRLEQIVSKLLSNALKYGAGQPVEIGVEADDARVRLWIGDYGPGIAPAEQARIFERFERAVPAKHYGGLGLGLWTVRKIVEAMGGSVQVESGEGQGATFTVELPRA